MEKDSYAPVPLRLVMGIIFSVAGYMKLVGIAGTIDYFTKLQFKSKKGDRDLLSVNGSWRICIDPA